MSEITCCMCDKKVPLTKKCRKLWGYDVCPECAENITRLVNKKMVESNDNSGEDEKEVEK